MKFCYYDRVQYIKLRHLHLAQAKPHCSRNFIFSLQGIKKPDLKILFSVTYKSCVGDDLGLVPGLDVQNRKSTGRIPEDEFGR